MRSVYEAGRLDRQLSITGNLAWGGDVRVYFDEKRKRAFTIGCPYAFSMANGMISYRSMARSCERNDPDRRHYVTQAIRIRDALCWGGLCRTYRTLVLSELALQEIPA